MSGFGFHHRRVVQGPKVSPVFGFNGLWGVKGSHVEGLGPDVLHEFGVLRVAPSRGGLPGLC